MRYRPNEAACPTLPYRPRWHGMSAIHKLVMVLALVAGPAWADSKPPLRDVHEIDNAMLWVALAIEIRDQCDAIGPRTLKGLSGTLRIVRPRENAQVYRCGNQCLRQKP